MSRARTREEAVRRGAGRPVAGRATLGLAAAAGLGVLLAGCESTQSKNAVIERKAAEVIRKQSLPFSIGKRSRTVKVKRAVVVSDDQGSAVAIELKVGGGHAQSRVPIVFSVKGKDGKVQFTNTVQGLQESLQHLDTAVPRKTTWWVNDQLLGAKDPVSVKAEVGEGVALAKSPEIKVTNTDFHPDPAGTYYEGTLVNETGQDLTQVPVFGVGLKGDTVVAAGRGIVPRLPAKAGPKPTRFRIFFTGDPTGTDMQVTVAPTVRSTPEGTTP